MNIILKTKIALASITMLLAFIIGAVMTFHPVQDWHSSIGCMFMFLSAMTEMIYVATI